MDNKSQDMSSVFTIGHSNQPFEEFISLLIKQNIERVVDVRSNPYSRFRHFNREPLSDRLTGQGIGYLYLGEQLGGHPESDDLYLNGRVVYDRLAALPDFRRGIKRLALESEQHSLAIMCTEENPKLCHRHPLLALALVERGVQVLHLRRDGSVQNAAAMTDPSSLQLPLLEPGGEDSTWQSPKRIRRQSDS
jgi:uncharacterized protein (DUF488 family)